MKIDVLIPTIGRADSLQKTIDSIAKCDDVIPLIGFETELRGYVLAMNELIARSCADVMILGNDDIEFFPGAIRMAVSELEYRFDGDGVIGFCQSNIKMVRHCHEYAFVAIGRKYIDRFPEGSFLCPNYLHWYADTEMGTYAESIGRFHFCEGARIYHGMPTVLSDYDHVRVAAQSMICIDHHTRNKRIDRGLLWGKSFDLVDFDKHKSPPRERKKQHFVIRETMESQVGPVIQGGRIMEETEITGLILDCLLRQGLIRYEGELVHILRPVLICGALALQPETIPIETAGAKIIMSARRAGAISPFEINEPKTFLSTAETGSVRLDRKITPPTEIKAANKTKGI